MKDVRGGPHRPRVREHVAQAAVSTVQKESRGAHYGIRPKITRFSVTNYRVAEYSHCKQRRSASRSMSTFLVVGCPTRNAQR